MSSHAVLPSRVPALVPATPPSNVVREFKGARLFTKARCLGQGTLLQMIGASVSGWLASGADLGALGKQTAGIEHSEVLKSVTHGLLAYPEGSGHARDQPSRREALVLKSMLDLFGDEGSWH